MNRLFSDLGLLSLTSLNIIAAKKGYSKPLKIAIIVNGIAVLAHSAWNIASAVKEIKAKD